MKARGNHFIEIDVRNIRIFCIVLTDVTSKGMVNTIKKEKHQAHNTDNVTIICCLGILPYRNSEKPAKHKAKHMANGNR